MAQLARIPRTRSFFHRPASTVRSDPPRRGAVTYVTDRDAQIIVEALRNEEPNEALRRAMAQRVVFGK